MLQVFENFIESFLQKNFTLEGWFHTMQKIFLECDSRDPQAKLYSAINEYWKPICQALIKMFYSKDDSTGDCLLEGFWRDDQIREIFSKSQKEKNTRAVSTKEDFIVFCKDENNKSEEEWNLLKECFKRIHCADVSAALSLYNIGVNVCLEKIDENTRETLFNIKKDVNSAILHSAACANPSMSVENKEDQNLISSALSFPLDILKFYFTGDKKSRWNYFNQVWNLRSKQVAT